MQAIQKCFKAKYTHSTKAEQYRLSPPSTDNVPGSGTHFHDFIKLLISTWSWLQGSWSVFFLFFFFLSPSHHILYHPSCPVYLATFSTALCNVLSSAMGPHQKTRTGWIPSVRAPGWPAHSPMPHRISLTPIYSKTKPMISTKLILFTQPLIQEIHVKHLPERQLYPWVTSGICPAS